MSIREHRQRVDAITPTAEQAVASLVTQAEGITDALQRVAFWRVVWDSAHGELHEAVAAARDAGETWSALAIAYDRSQPSTFGKFADKTRKRDRPAD